MFLHNLDWPFDYLLNNSQVKENRKTSKKQKYKNASIKMAQSFALWHWQTLWYIRIKLNYQVFGWIVWKELKKEHILDIISYFFSCFLFFVLFCYYCYYCYNSCLFWWAKECASNGHLWWLESRRALVTRVHWFFH